MKFHHRRDYLTRLAFHFLWMGLAGIGRRLWRSALRYIQLAGFIIICKCCTITGSCGCTFLEYFS